MHDKQKTKTKMIEIKTPSSVNYNESKGIIVIN